MSERDWASLEKGVLRDVFIRLSSDDDAVHFRRVCQHWRLAAGDGVLVPRPWFVLKPPDDDDAARTANAFVRPVHCGRRTRIRSVRVDAASTVTGGCSSAAATVTGGWSSAYVRGTSRGWLAVGDGERLLLRDPISRAEIPLPAFDAGYQLFDVFLSDDPLAAPASWTAFAIFMWNDVYNPAEVLAFCRPGDAEWARVDPVDGGGGQQVHEDQETTRLYRGLEFFGGRPYVLLGKPHRLAVCDVEARRLVLSSVTIFRPPGWKWEHWQECLVECGGDLLVVQMERYGHYRSPWYCPGFCLCSHHFERHTIRYFANVFKIVFDADGSGMPVALEAVESPGDYAVFVAPQGHAFALPASGFPAVRAGCIYFFAVNSTRSVQAMVVADLNADPRRQIYKIVRKLPLAGQWHILSWFCPRPALDATLRPRRCRLSMQPS